MEIFDIRASNMTNFHWLNVIFSHILDIKWRKISLKTACVWAAQISSYRLPKVQKDAVRYRAASAQNIRPCRDAHKENIKTSHTDFVSVVLVLIMHLIPNNPTFTSKILEWRRKNKNATNLKEAFFLGHLVYTMQFKNFATSYLLASS